MRKRVLGFTLIELMIVVAIIAIIAAIAIPGLLRARISANEGSAAAGLRSLASGQASFAKAASVDQDGDGQGEYGTLNELSGQSQRRYKSDKTVLPILSIGDMSAGMAATTNSVEDATAGLAQKSGYYYHLYLPGNAEVVSDLADKTLSLSLDYTVTEDSAAIQQQENRWICYAWPTSAKSSGLKAFVCDQSAEVYSSTNSPDGGITYIWDGVRAGQEPAYSDAMVADEGGVTPTITNWLQIATGGKVAIDASHTWVSAQ